MGSTTGGNVRVDDERRRGNGNCRTRRRKSATFAGAAPPAASLMTTTVALSVSETAPSPQVQVSAAPLADVLLATAIANKTSASGAAETCTWGDGAVSDTDNATVVVIKLAAGGAAPAKVADFRRRVRQFPFPRRRSSSTRTFPPVVLPIPVLPPQATGRKRPQWRPSRRSYVAQPVRAQVVVQTAQALPPQPTRGRLFAQLRRRGYATTVTVTTTTAPAQTGARPVTPRRLRRRAF